MSGAADAGAAGESIADGMSVRSDEQATRRRPPRLLLRYLAAGLLLVIASVGSTLWLAQTAEYRFDQQSSDAALARNEQILDELTLWAGRHPTWDGVGPELLELAHDTGRRIALVGGDGKLIADSAPTLPRPEESTSTFDPLEEYAEPGTLQLRLHRGIVGPFGLSDAQQAALTARAADVRACLGESVIGSTVWATGRPVVWAADDAPDCGRTRLDTPLPSEQSALDDLRDLTNRCLLDAGAPAIDRIALDLSSTSARTELAFRTNPAATDATAECLLRAQADQASAFTAPNVQIVLTDLRGNLRGPFDASPGTIARLAIVVVVLLALLAAAAAIILAPTLRSARKLEAAADRFAAGERAGRSGVGAKEDLAHVGAAFDRMSAEIAGHETARRRLLGDVAHELRSPLTNIRGWVEAADDGLGMSDAELRRLVLTEAGRMETITRDLQLLALAETGDLAVDFAPVDAAEVVRSVVAAHLARAAAADVALVAEVDGPLLMRTDAARLGQILSNLVGNALRHTAAGGSVRVGAGATGGTVRFEVIDDGEGIAADDVPFVFDRLWRGDPARTRSGESSGLGLSIVQGLSQALGGSVEVTSEVGAGSRFTVFLPGSPD